LIKEDINKSGFNILKTYRIFEHTYHSFLIIEKENLNIAKNNSRKRLNMKNDPIVSVIIPTYNRAHLIDRAIESVLNQTYQDFKMIIADYSSRN